MNNKNNFLNKLSESLYFFSDEERTQVIADYEELIVERNRDGEELQDIIESLDKPEDIAKNYAHELGIKYSKSKKYITNTQNKSKKYITDTQNKSKNKFNTFKNRNQDKQKSELKNRNYGKSKIAKTFNVFIYVIITTGLIIKSLFKFFVTLFLYVTLISLIIGLILFLLLFQFEAYNFLIKLLISTGMLSGISLNIIMIYLLNKYLGSKK